MKRLALQLSPITKRRVIQWLGGSLTVAGLFLVTVGLVGMNMPTECPGGGCSANALSSIYGPYYTLFYVGLALIISGILSLAISFTIKLNPGMSVERESISTERFLAWNREYGVDSQSYR